MKRVRPFPFADLPRLGRAQVEAARVLLSHLPVGPGAEFADACSALGGPVEIELAEIFALPARDLALHARGATLRLEAAHGRWALVVIDPQLAPRLARRALGTDESAELPAPRPLTLAEEGALTFLVGALVEPLRVAGLLRDDEIEALARVNPDGWCYALSARLATPAGAGWARVLAPESLRLALPPPATGAALRRAERLADARITLTVELGRLRLPRGELAQIAAGDVVLMDAGVRDTRGGPVRLRLGAGEFAARMDGEALTVLEPFRQRSASDMDDNKPAAAEALLGELPVEVVCELGRVSMSGRELLELRPGAVIPVGRPLAGPVDLTVGGRVVARGELVDVEGEIGVRVTQLYD